MGLRPASCYSKDSKRVYSRYARTKQRKNFIGAVPGLRLRQFNSGNSIKEFETIIDLKSNEHVQIRDNALEAARSNIVRGLTKKLGKDGFFLKMRIYPHNILRENKQAQGAGADRVSQGMSHPFGKPIGRAAPVKKGTKILSVLVDKKNIPAVKEVLGKAKAKFPGTIKISVHKDVLSIGTKPSKRRQAEREKATKAKAAKAAAKAAEEGKDEKPEAEKKNETKTDAKTVEKKLSIL